MATLEDTSSQSIATHRGFALSRPGLAQILRLSILMQEGSNMSYEDIRAETTLGTVQVDAFRRYARHTGLLESDARPSTFGKVVFSNDLEFGELQTQWLMHYFMVSLRHECPLFWRWLALKHLKAGDVYSSANIALLIEEMEFASSGRKLAKITYQRGAEAFVGTYSKEDAFGKLGLLKKIGDKYEVREPVPPSVNAFAYALAVHWEAVWQERSTVNLRELMDENGLAPLLFLNSGETDYYLAEMQEAGLLEVHRLAPPYQVVRLWKSPQTLLERLYD